MKSWFAAAVFAACLQTSAAHAHIVATPASAAANATVPVSFRVGHGCDGAATTQLRVEIPAGIVSARPQAKTGWRMEITREGKDGPVTAITWTGNLPDSQFDEFQILVKLPAKDGRLYFPVVQSCGRMVEQWTEIPDSPGESLTHPAPVVTIAAAAPLPAGDAMADMPGM